MHKLVKNWEPWLAHLYKIISQHPVGNRPNRREPRAIKRRAKPYRKLREPRAMAKYRLHLQFGLT